MRMKSINKIFIIFLSLLMFVSAISVTAFAEAMGGQENCEYIYGNYEYSIISAKEKTCRITNYFGTETKVSLPSKLNGYTVTEIGELAFEWCYETLESVIIPETVEKIYDCAFYSCSKLTNITIPDSINSIGWAAFMYTGYYDDYSNWKNGVLYIGNHLIEANENITGTYTIKKGTKTIADSAFQWCNVTEVKFPDSVTSIGYSAFYGCDALSSVTFGDTLTTIGKSAFAWCNSLETVTLPARVSYIAEDAFYTCDDNTDEEIYKTIKAYSGTYAEIYAKENGHIFVSLGGAPKNYTGLYKLGDTWCYFENGMVNYDYTGLVKHTNGIWYYVEDGVLDWSYSGLWKHNGTWYYVQKGQINWKFTGLVKHTNGTWYYVQGAKLNWGYTGLVKHTTGSWFYVQKGKINFDYTGLVKHTNGIWYYIKNGKLDWNYNGLWKHNGTWYYLQKGQINWNYTGLVKHTNGIWYYVKGAKINWNYTGLVKHTNNKWYYVQKGQINFNYTGYVTYNGTRYKVVNGVKV